MTAPSTPPCSGRVHALHARRSADSIARWAQARGTSADAPGLGVVLTGTDLYRDIQSDAVAQASLAQVQSLVLLQVRAHEATRRHIQRTHLLVLASRMEGGAHVMMEAMCAGTPVLASRIAGNVGMLGSNYAGCLKRAMPGAWPICCRADRAGAGFIVCKRLNHQIGVVMSHGWLGFA